MKGKIAALLSFLAFVTGCFQAHMNPVIHYGKIYEWYRIREIKKPNEQSDFVICKRAALIQSGCSPIQNVCVEELSKLSDFKCKNGIERIHYDQYDPSIPKVIECVEFSELNFK